MITRHQTRQGAQQEKMQSNTVWKYLGPQLALAAALTLTFGLYGVCLAAEPKGGGLLNATLEEAPPSFSIHEEATAAAVWPVMPCYNNLLLFDPLKRQESTSTIIGEWAERWGWQGGGKTLVFHLRKGVRWQDGQSFSSKDVLYTFDV
ncbi:MAG TPA: ABC transporter substrate-binding protein, partial [Candidatus Methylomirabilis sp.]|nr:ABC transporter substrate-binding protein [Candidatus Methylomirabilis sp.]